MTQETIENQNTDISLKKLWKLPLIQEILSAFLLAMLSGSVVSYFLSKLFIRDYLAGIGFESLIYQALIDTSTVSSLTLAIVVIVFSLLLIFMMPSVLRYLYHEKIHLFTEYHEKNKKKIEYVLVGYLCLMPVIAWSILQFVKWGEYLGGLVCSLPLVLFLHSIRKTIEADKRREATEWAVLFSLATLLMLMPFVFILTAIYTAFKNDVYTLIFVAIVWAIYSFIYGVRITEKQAIHYGIDGLIAVLVIFLLSWFTPISLIKEPVAEVIGLKDKEPRIYAISEKYFMEIKHDIDTHWYHYQNDEKTEGNAVFYVQREADNKVYINTQIIFRSDKHMVLCPPNYNVIKQKEGACFIVSREYLTPTTFKTMPFINKSEKVL